VHAGKGGDGVASFRREKFVPRGGPDGGDGGRGGSILVLADRNINTLIDYRYARIHRAKNGQKGQGSDCYGRSAEDIVLRVPVGTVISDFDSGSVVADLAEHDARALLAKGGRGGLGNLHFKSSTNRAPRQFTPGEPGRVESSSSSSKCSQMSDFSACRTPASPPSYARSLQPGRRWRTTRLRRCIPISGWCASMNDAAS